MSIDKKNLQQRALADYLADRHEALLDSWGEAVKADPQLQTASYLSFTHFRDLMPKVLKNFEKRLRAMDVDPAAESDLEQEEHERVLDHGVHRWTQGFALHELVREWHHLQIAVLRELEGYGAAHREVDPEVMSSARLLWTELCGEGIVESVEQYARLQKEEATGHLLDLQSAMEALRGSERQRAESWHEAAHDLRGNVGLVTSTTSILTEDGVPESLRAKALGILQSSVTSLQQLLEDLMSLARLEAGRDTRNVEELDAAALLRTLGESLRPMAIERGLFLRTEGPASLPVEGDPAKIYRVVQNLALNALKYTDRGGVEVSWAETRESDIDRWWIRIRDTGPGLHNGPGAPMIEPLREGTDRARELEVAAAGPDQVEPVPGSGSSTHTLSPGQQPGEGIGLSIVKRLCELLE
ncbi:MAG TPA: HAMP domain-containing sensor histidine kinase, partial [Thermoanaerobaculia bacterium]|nr:HAMP domain-containing sensor histidine kinase [Thermoanaerobaculia bacterium]